MKLVLGSESKVPVVGPAHTITLYVLTVRFRRRVSAFFASRLFTMLNTCCMTASWRRSSLPYHAPPHPPPTNQRHHNVTVNNVTVCQSCPSAPMYTHTRLTALCPGLPGWAGTRKVKPIWILFTEAKRRWVAVASAGLCMQLCTSLQTGNHASTPPLCSHVKQQKFCFYQNNIVKLWWHSPINKS